MNKLTAAKSKFRRLTALLKPPFSAAARFSTQVFVNRLSFYTTNEQLKGMFSPYGKVQEARLVMDNRTGRTKGFGFVTYETEDEAQNAIKALNGRIVQGRLIFAEIANSGKNEGQSGHPQN